MWFHCLLLIIKLLTVTYANSLACYRNHFLISVLVEWVSVDLSNLARATAPIVGRKIHLNHVPFWMRIMKRLLKWIMCLCFGHMTTKRPTCFITGFLSSSSYSGRLTWDSVKITAFTHEKCGFNFIAITTVLHEKLYGWARQALGLSIAMTTAHSCILLFNQLRSFSLMSHT